MNPARQTWRVQGVPNDFTKEKLTDVLKNHLPLSAGNATAAGHSDAGVRVCTLASTFRSDKIATVRFRSVPPKLAELGPRGQLTIDIPALENTDVGIKHKQDPPLTTKLVVDKHFEGVSVLYNPAEGHNVDILAISGLGSHPYGSFTHKEDGHMWLSDSLPQDMPTARIMIYGYESGLQNNTSFSNLEDFASSLKVTLCQVMRSRGAPLVLIGHSLGGLLIKEALVLIAESDSDSNLTADLVGILFFGTPHKGMDIESLVPMVYGQPNKPFVESLSNMESVILKMQQRNFNRVLKQTKLQIFCFYETQESPTAAKDQSGNYKMSGPKRPLVSIESATSCLTFESSDHSIAVDRTHSDLVKFPLHDAVYERVSYILAQMQRNHRTTAPAIRHNRLPTTRDTTETGEWLVPFGRNKDFVGRERILDQLLDLIPPRKDRDSCQWTAIEGLGGIGKTQIALEAAFRVRDEDPGCAIFWVPAVDIATFENAYRQIGRQLKIPGIDEDGADIKALVKTALSLGGDDWLLIIDNADDVALLFGDASLRDYLPASHKGSILFTTRTHDMVRKLDIRHSNNIRVDVLSRPESMELMEKSLRPEQLSDKEITLELLDFLADLPLAVKQASAYIDKTGLTTTQYLKHCRSSDTNRIKLLSKNFEDRGRYGSIQSAQNPIATTWLISFGHLSRDYPLAVQYLKHMSFLSEKDIPISLLSSDDGLEMDEAIGALKAYAFVSQRTDQGSYDVHRLVQIAMRNWLGEQGELEECVTSLIQQLIEKFPYPEHENRATWIEYLPHAMAALEFRNSLESNPAKSILLARVAESNAALGKYQNAEGFHHKALALRKHVFGDEHPDTLISMNDLAIVLRRQGKYEEAEAMNRQALALKKQVLGDEHPDTLASMNNLAAVLNSQGKYEEAEAMLRQVQTLYKRVLGDEHPDTLQSMNNLAVVFSSQGKYEEAEAILRQELALTKQVLGDEHSDTLISMNNLAHILNKQGGYEEAEAIHRQVLALKKQVLGDNHPYTPTSLNNLAIVLYSQGKYEEAEAMLRQALALTQQVLSDNHPDTLRNMNNLAAVLNSQGKYEEAEAIHRQVQTLYKQVLGDEHPDTLQSMNNLAVVLDNQGKCEEAEAMHRQALALRKQMLGDNHPDTLISMHNLATVLDSQGKEEEAEIYRQVPAVGEMTRKIWRV